MHEVILFFSALSCVELNVVMMMSDPLNLFVAYSLKEGNSDQ